MLHLLYLTQPTAGSATSAPVRSGWATLAMPWSVLGSGVVVQPRIIVAVRARVRVGQRIRAVVQTDTAAVLSSASVSMPSAFTSGPWAIVLPWSPLGASVGTTVTPRTISAVLARVRTGPAIRAVVRTETHALL